MIALAQPCVDVVIGVMCGWGQVLQSCIDFSTMSTHHSFGEVGYGATS